MLYSASSFLTATEIAFADQCMAGANVIVDDLICALADMAKEVTDVEIVAAPILSSLFIDGPDDEHMLDTRLIVNVLTVALTRLARIESENMCKDTNSHE